MTEVSERCTPTQQQQKLSLHSRKRRRPLEETYSQKSHAVSLTWSTPQFLECSGQDERKSGIGREPYHADGHEQEGTRVGNHGLESKITSAAPGGLNMVVEPSRAQPSNMALSLMQSTYTHAMPEGGKLRAAASPAGQEFGMSSIAYQAKASSTASAPARLASTVPKADGLASVPARRHHGTEQKTMEARGLAYLASPKQAGQRPRARLRPGFAHDDISVDATSEQWGRSAGGARSVPGRSRSAASLAARSSSTGSGSAANATQALMQVCTYLKCRICCFLSST